VKLRTRVLLLSLLAAALALPVLPASAADPGPTVTLTASKSVYVAGQTIRLTSSVVASNLTFLAQVRYVGSSEWSKIDFARNVNTATFSIKLGTTYYPYNMTVRALLIDEHGTFDDSSDDTVVKSVSRSIGVKAGLSIAPVGYYIRSGGYAVYSKGSSPKFQSDSDPGFPGKRCLRHQVQRRYASGWRGVLTSACKVEAKLGRVSWQWAGKHASGVKFRVRPTFAGDAVNKANLGPWFYFRFR
jgi:hypothetical protein